MTDNESGCYARKLLFYYGPDVNLILLFRQSVPKGARKIIFLYFRQGKNWSWFLAFQNVASVVIHSIIVHPSDYIYKIIQYQCIISLVFCDGTDCGLIPHISMIKEYLGGTKGLFS